MWDSFQVLYDSIKDIKEFKINMLIEEYKLFRIEPGETVESMQMHFIH